MRRAPRPPQPSVSRHARDSKKPHLPPLQHTGHLATLSPELCPCHLPACTHLPPSAGRGPGLHGTAGDERLESVCFTFNPPFTTTRRGGPSPRHHPPSLVTQPKNFNLHGLSVVVKYNTNGAGLVYPEAMKLLSEEIDTHY